MRTKLLYAWIMPKHLIALKSNFYRLDLRAFFILFSHVSEDRRKSNFCAEDSWGRWFFSFLIPNQWKDLGFRVSPEEHEHINIAVALSGLTKQEYCYRRCLGRDIVVQGNPKVYKALKEQLALVLDELKRIEAGKGVDDELLENINLITRTLQGLNK